MPFKLHAKLIITGFPLKIYTGLAAQESANGQMLYENAKLPTEK